MWSFKTRNFILEWRTKPGVLDTQGMDPQIAQETLALIKAGAWTCFSSEISIRHRSSTQILGRATLRSSVLVSSASFRDHFGIRPKGHHSYFSELVRQAIAQARIRFAALQRDAKLERLKAERILGTPLRQRVPDPSQILAIET
jgi:hypothetical protein